MISLSPKRAFDLAGLVIAGALLGGLVACQSNARQQAAGGGTSVDTTAIIAALDSMRSAYAKAYAARDFERMASIVHPEMIYAPPGRPPGRLPTHAY